MERTSTIGLPGTKEDLLRLVSRCIALPRVSSIQITPNNVSVTRTLESETERVVPQDTDDDGLDGRSVVLSSIEMTPIDDLREAGVVMNRVLNRIREQDLLPAAFVISSVEIFEEWSGSQEQYFYGMPIIWDDSETVSSEKAVIIGSNTGLITDACLGYVVDMVT